MRFEAQGSKDKHRISFAWKGATGWAGCEEMIALIFCLDVAKSCPTSLKYFRDEKFAFQVN